MVFAMDVTSYVISFGVSIGRFGEILYRSVHILERWVVLMRGVSICTKHLFFARRRLMLFALHIGQLVVFDINFSGMRPS